MTDVYKIGVSLAMTSNGAQVLGALSKHLLGIHTQTNQLTGGFNRLKLAIGGALAIAGGVALIGAFKKPLEEAAKYQTQLARFKQFGMADGINAAADKYARATRVMGSSATDMMRYMVEAQGVFRESGALTEQQALLGSRIAAPILAKINFANSSLSDEDRERYSKQDLMMLRFIEARGGANDPATFSRIADWGFKLIQSSGGNINWDQLRGLVKTAGAAGFNLSESAISKLEPVITDMGGGTVGSGMRVAFSRLLGIQRGLPKQAIQEYLSLGLWDPSKVELSSGGGVQRFLGKPGDVLKDREKFATDPVGFYIENFLPAISKKYGQQILGDTVSAKVQRAAEITNVFGPGSAGNVFSQIDKLMPAILRSVAAQNKALGIDASDKNAAQTLRGKEIILQKNWQTLMLQLGDHVLPLAIKGLTFLNRAIEKLSNWAALHPGQMDFFVKTVLVVGAALTGLGIVAVGAAAVLAIGAGGPLAIIIAGIAALAGAVGVLALANWGGATKAVESHRNAQEYVKTHPGAQFLPIGDLYSRANAAALHKKITEGLSHTYHKDAGGNWVPDTVSNLPPRAANQNANVTVPVYLDGKKIAEASAKVFNQQFGYGGASGRFDPTAALPAAGLGYAR